MVKPDKQNGPRKCLNKKGRLEAIALRTGVFGASFLERRVCAAFLQAGIAKHGLQGFMAAWTSIEVVAR